MFWLSRHTDAICKMQFFIEDYQMSNRKKTQAAAAPVTQAPVANDPIKNTSISDSLAELSSRHTRWFETEYKASQHALYEVLADCLTFYVRIKDENKAQRAHLDTYLAKHGIQVGANSSLLGKVVKAMCGANSSKVNAYISVLKIAYDQGKKPLELKEWLIEQGGIAKVRETFRKRTNADSRDVMVAKGMKQLGISTALGSHPVPSNLTWDDTNDTKYAVALVRKDGEQFMVMHYVTRRALVQELLESIGKRANDADIAAAPDAAPAKTREQLAAEVQTIRDAA